MPLQDFSFSTASSSEILKQFGLIVDASIRPVLHDIAFWHQPITPDYGPSNFGQIIDWLVDNLGKEAYLDRDAIVQELKAILKQESALFGSLAKLDSVPFLSGQQSNGEKIPYQEFANWWDSPASWIWKRSSRTILTKVNFE